MSGKRKPRVSIPLAKNLPLIRPRVEHSHVEYPRKAKHPADPLSERLTARDRYNTAG
jgi:hypothetical protein